MAKKTAAEQKAAILGIDKTIDGLISLHYAKDGREQLAKEAYKTSKEKYEASLVKERELLIAEVEILEVELAEAQSKAVPTESQVMRAELEVKKAEQALNEKFESGLVDATREIVQRAIDGYVAPSFHKTLRRIRTKDVTLPQVAGEVRALETAKANLAAMAETAEVKRLKDSIKAYEEQIADIDAYLADEVTA